MQKSIVPLLLLLVCCTTACEPDTPPPPVCEYYEFNDGLILQDFSDDACVSGEMDKLIQEVARLYDDKNLNAALNIDYDQLKRSAQLESRKTMSVYNSVGGREAKLAKKIFARLTRHTMREDIDYQLIVVENPRRKSLINAWCNALGQVYITAEMLRRFPDENVLAFVLAHELAHLENLHIAKDIAFRLSVEEKLGSVISTLLGTGPDQLLQSLNTYQELVSDRAALFLMNEAGYDPVGGLDFFGELDRETAGSRKGLILGPLLRTHPYHHTRFSCLAKYLHQSAVKLPCADSV